MTNKNTNTEINLTSRKLQILSKNVARQRKVAGMTKAEFARNTTVSRDTIRRIETLPEGYVPTQRAVEALANLAGASVKEILTRKLSFA
jgi:DNA-binding XRE family transcriptional regulator